MLYLAKVLNRELFSYLGKDLLYLGAIGSDDPEIVDIYSDVQIRFCLVDK